MPARQTDRSRPVSSQLLLHLWNTQACQPCCWSRRLTSVQDLHLLKQHLARSQSHGGGCERRSCKSFRVSTRLLGSSWSIAAHQSCATPSSQSSSALLLPVPQACSGRLLVALRPGSWSESGETSCRPPLPLAGSQHETMQGSLLAYSISDISDCMRVAK